jgi:anhydro-N-acetylmuramic acid kinase
VQLIASHGHTVFHEPKKRMTAQLGDGASIAAETKINVISDLRAMDIALGGQGAPIVPIGEKLLLNEYDFFLNLGGIANVSVNSSILQNKQSQYNGQNDFVAFDICPANRVLNMLSHEAGKSFDENGELARTGKVDRILLEKLNAFEFYREKYPKSLANDFGTNEVYPLIKNAGSATPDALHTYVEHMAIQIRNAVEVIISDFKLTGRDFKLLATGGGVHNLFLVERLTALLVPLQVELIVADNQLADYKEALIMALIGVLRWREEVNVLSSVTGAKRNSIGGAVWIGQEI